MSFIRVTLLVPLDKEQALEEAIKQIELAAMVVVKVRGYGDHPNFYSTNWTTESAMFELYLAKDYMEQLKKKIRSVCNVDGDNEGIMIVSDVSEMLAIKNI
ncbi:hypothetical protein BTA51_29525 [Hahella sp. CCB-MM4]|uniref:P-II family nitrogen regulator n=1 Tax=Hahella sp. (strain CCB-MM4) TaxID=1926491 RepID=UPI000B9BE2BC|nr:hypothetical protein [Hahella sp. CCB-MM4]OZG69766.1 hypothetical protein BTA51_29525 [Hahella sp. CCB-MM4]